MNLKKQRCIIHPEREAVGRCPACHRFFCRECLTEHEGRLLCVNCLKKASVTSDHKASNSLLRRLFRPLLQGAALLTCFLLLWAFFTLAGVILSAIPDSFHYPVFEKETD